MGIVIAFIAAHILLPVLLNMCSDSDHSYQRAISLFNYIMFFPWTLLLILFQTRVIDPAPWVDLLPIVLTPLTYSVVFLESCYSQEEGFLSEPSSEDETFAYIDSLRVTKPSVVTHVECYHRERRTRRVRDSKGNYRTETYYVTVITWRGSKRYEIPYWRDTSEPNPNFNPTCSTRLTLPDVVHFADEASRQHFEADRRQFVNENRHRDRSIRYETSIDIPGHIKRRMVCGRDYTLFLSEIFYKKLHVDFQKS